MRRIFILSLALLALTLVLSHPAKAQLSGSVQLEWQPGFAGFNAPFKIAIGSNGISVGVASPGIETPIGQFSISATGRYNSTSTDNSASIPPVSVLVYLDNRLLYSRNLPRLGNYQLSIEKNTYKFVSCRMEGGALKIYLTYDDSPERLNHAREIIGAKNQKIVNLNSKVGMLRSQRDEAYRAVKDMEQQAIARGNRANGLQEQLNQKDHQISTLRTQIASLEATIQENQVQIAELQRQVKEMGALSGTSPTSHDPGMAGQSDFGQSNKPYNIVQKTMSKSSVVDRVRAARQAVNDLDRAAGRPTTFPRP